MVRVWVMGMAIVCVVTGDELDVVGCLGWLISPFVGEPHRDRVCDMFCCMFSGGCWVIVVL